MLAVMPSLSSVSIEFLLKEYEQLWLQLRDMYNYLLKVYGFYITVLGAAIAGTVTLLHTETGVQSPLSLPTFFVVASIGVLVILAATLMLHVAKLRSVATEYLNALNRIRRGFCELDQPVDTYLNLDAKDFTGSKWRNIDFYSYASVALLSGLLLAALDLFLSYKREMLPPLFCVVSLGVILIMVWCAAWVGIWPRASKPRLSRHGASPIT